MLKPIVFWGASGHAKVLREFTAALGYRLVAVFDNTPSTPAPFPDIPLFYGREGFLTWRRTHPDSAGCLVAIGGARGQDRCKLQEFMVAHGLTALAAVHPTAFVAGDVVLAAGCQVLAQSAVAAGTRLGPATIINTSASVDHECVLGAGVHVGPGATLAGCVQIGDGSFVGSGAVVLPRIRVGGNSIIGAGSVVTRDIPDGKIAYGNPAKVIRENTPP